MRKILHLTLLSCLFTSSVAFSKSSLHQDVRRVILLLKEPPLCSQALDSRGKSLYKGFTTLQEDCKKELIQRRAKIRSNQLDFEAKLKALAPGAAVKRRFTGLINGMSIDLPAESEDAIRSMPEVLAVAPNRKYHLCLTRSNELMNMSAVWQASGGQEEAGKGIKIGIMDTGVDSTHIVFGSTGYEYPEGYPLGDADFTTPKVIVARVFPYKGDAAKASTPRDRDGHGTHVASCAAGNANVESPLGLMSGVAPKAYIGNYKIFTTEHAHSEQIISALEACVEDGMDIVNMSFADEYYIDELFDPEAIAIKNAIRAGLVLVAAAGNYGQKEAIYFPGQIPEVITVGSLGNSHTGENPTDNSIAYLNAYADGEKILEDEVVILAQDPDYFTEPLIGTFPLVDADHLDGGSYGGSKDGLVCEELPSESIDGDWALIQRGDCTFTSKINSVQSAGGSGALIYNSSTAPEGPDEPLQKPSSPDTYLPSYHISRNAGLLIKDAIQDSNLVEIEILAPPPTETNQRAFGLSSFSSTGPSLSYTIKPELTAIGEGSFAATQNDFPGEFQSLPSGDYLLSTYFTISGFTFFNGTSFSAPRVAGAAAVIKQNHPDWSPEEIKAALVLAADRPATIASKSSMERGGGHVNPARAIQIPIIANPSTLSFGCQSTAGEASLEKSVVIKNISDQTQSMFLSLEFDDTPRIASYNLSQDAASLSAGDAAEIQIQIQASPPSTFSQAEDFSGDLVIQVEGLEEPLRLPIWARIVHAPEPAGSVLLVDDDGGASYEDSYESAIQQAGYDWTTWDVHLFDQYPTQDYMQSFDSVVWFMSTNSLYSNDSESTANTMNHRTRFHIELTRYLSLGGKMILSGMDWSDAQEDSTLAKQVWHITEFEHDPYVSYDPVTGAILRQNIEMLVSADSGNPIAAGLDSLTVQFDDDLPNMTDLLTIDDSGFAQAALHSTERESGIVGITIDANSYRAVFFSFPLERISGEGMNLLIKNSLDWMLDDPKQAFSLQSITPAAQNDNSMPSAATLLVDGVNFQVGYTVLLNDQLMQIDSINLDGEIEIEIPAGLTEGIYDITVISPDGQTATLTQGYQVGNPTTVDNWSLY
ncbi:MAG: S8 family serine peptidase [Candidatus Omnitrophica bacterium]|nr:S8 family serine peptidase [Candidatus Omnitrophota bacterium]